MARLLISLVLALLLAACVSGPAPEDGAARKPFTAVDDEGGPSEASPRPATPEDEALSTEERARAALLIYELSRSTEAARRHELLEALVALGPRYLPYLRSIEDPELQLDLAYVMNRIEEEAPPVAETPAAPVREEGKPPRPPEAPRRRGGAGSEGLEETPRYQDEPGSFDVAQVERFLSQRLADARQALAMGDHERARRIAQAALTLMPESRLRPDFEDVLLQARSQGQSATLIAGTMSLEPDALHYARRERGAGFVTPLSIKCYLKNVSTQVVKLWLGDGPGKESIVELNVRYEQLDYQGNSLATEGRVLLPVAAQGTLVLQPNDSYELSVELTGLNSLDVDGPVKYTLGQVTARAALRVYGAKDAEDKPIILRPIAFPARSVKVFPADFDLTSAQDRPIQAISEAISKNRPQDLFLASQLVEKKQVRVVGDLLLGEDLETCGLGLQRARLRAMASLTGVGATFDSKKWKAWWAENKFKY